ncbi:wax ester/triacylglycerol synthase family O-acyltransferase [Mycobacterium sp. ACS1612]|uniref:wax ester/triacylglycerol synthase family O-acyltransferase n=1 Tax=Mycobacterium sp. ACS1612 TaxID=1834117 RepID=UPI000834BD42|nr:wax ester/triacylglycerol synthase family O-acyltransferase [Mycobacterium sp. ACS1612]
MSLADRVFLSSDTDVVHTHISGVPIFRIPGTVSDFVEDLMTRARSSAAVTPPFNYRVPARWPRRRWEIIDVRAVDFSAHVLRTALPSPGSMRDLETVIAHIHSKPLDRSKPLWELHIIDGLADGRIALCLKVHHALMDAMTLLKFMARTFSSSPNNVELQPIWALPPRSSACARPKRLGLARTFGVVGELLLAAWRILLEAWRRTDPAFAIPLRCPRSRLLNGLLSRERSWAAIEFDARRLHDLARRADASLNELILAALSTVLRHYLSACGELPRRSLTAGVPASNRGPDADPRHDASGMILVNLFTDVADPAERLHNIIRSSRLAKEHVASMSRQAADRYAVLAMAPALLQAATGLSGRVRAPFNVTVSNVAGPSTPQYLLGAPMDGLFAAAPIFPGQLLNLSVVSAAGRLGVAFTACAAALDARRLADLFGDAVGELETQIVAATA